MAKQKRNSNIQKNESDSTSNFSVVDQDANISASGYAHKCKELTQLSRELRDLGLSMLVDLPRIVVIGGQSAGKSSLVEAVTGICVPRDSGTCTKCPMECTMTSSSDRWSCSVSLRIEYGDDGKPLPSSGVVRFSPVLTDKRSVEIWLRRAQAAILSPHLPYECFLDKSKDQLQEMTTTDDKILKFSKNVVCVDIKDSTGVDLSFVDLPGLIQNESPSLIGLVRDLVVSYIEGGKTIILVTIPMGDDMENQQAVRLAKEADPRGERTIGVLTKPDTLPVGAMSSRKKWKDVIEGQAYPLKHGYYCVRLPDEDERISHISRSQSQRRAADFFDSTSPWKEMPNRSRFGIPSFVSDISRLLVGFIESSLPDLKSDVNRLLIGCHNEQSRLPIALKAELPSEIVGRITAFCNALRDAVSGEEQESGLIQQNRKCYNKFKQHIRNTAPDFRPFDDYENYKKPLFPNSENDVVSPSFEVEVYDLGKVRDVIDQYLAWQLPGNIPFSGKKALIRQFVGLWRDPSMLCFHEIYAILSKTVDVLTIIHFGRFKQLEAYMSTLIHKEIERSKEQTLQAIDVTLQLEYQPIFTQNTHYLKTEKQRWLSLYRGLRRNLSHYRRYGARSEDEGDGSETGSDHESDVHSVAQVQVDGPPPQPEQSLVPDPDFDDEIQVMAEVRAYFQVAYKRIIDNIPLTIEHAMNQPLPNKLQENLVLALYNEPNVSEKIKELLSEDPAIAIKKVQLDHKQRRLIEIKQRLEDFENNSSARE